MGATTRCTHHTTPVPRPPTLYLRRQAPRRAFIHHNKYQVLPSVQVPSILPLQPPVRRTGMPLIILTTSTFRTLDTLHQEDTGTHQDNCIIPTNTWTKDKHYLTCHTWIHKCLKMWTYINTIYTSSFFTCKVRGFISNELFVYCVVSCLIIKCVICYTPTGVHFTSTCLIYDQLYLTIISILQEMCKGIPPNTFIFSI